MADLSILIPARNEMFLAKTIENILENIEGDTEIIVVLDGAWADPPVIDDDRVTIIHYGESIGQRAATNAACRLSKAKYVMKVDAHCAFDKGFDVKMMAEMKDNWTMVPIMKNLHAFDWVCIGAEGADGCGHRQYQGPTPEKCQKCGGRMEREVLWRAKPSPNSTSYCFDSTPHFQYFNEYAKRPEAQGDLSETLSLQGSCFMLTREKYWELNICDENFGSWGSQGIEVALKTWMSGGRVVCNKKTWYAHMFRTQGGDFGFPYPLSGSQISQAKEYAKNSLFSGKWPKQVHSLSWVLNKFWPVPGWEFIPEPMGPEIDDSVTVKPVSKGIIYYTDNQLNLKIAHKVQKQLKSIGLPIVSASLKPMDFGKNIHLPLKRGYLTMFKQILAALEASEAEVIFFCEHDVLYHPSHFDFTPDQNDVYYYNENVWKVRVEDGHALHYDCKQLSGLCANRELLLNHYRTRVALVEKAEQEMEPEDFSRYVRSMGFEPGTHNRAERVDDHISKGYMSELPNIDIRHDNNLTPSRWNKDQFRSQRNCKNWIESDQVPGWSNLIF